MPKPTKTREEFIIQSKAIYGELYDYSLVEYKNTYTKVKLICSKHGIFETLPSNNLQGRSSCMKCSKEKVVRDRVKKYKDLFIKKAVKIHKNRYDYSLANYIGNRYKVAIICPVHGIFHQIPNSHLNGNGCPTCGFERTQKAHSDSLEEFIEKARKVHGDKYDYSKVNYKNNQTKIIITCPIHGDFKQLPINHYKYECGKCGDLKLKTQFNRYSTTGWINSSKKSKRFDSFKLYQLKCWNETEIFFKIGITYLKIERRYQSKKLMPYNYEVLDAIIEKPEIIKRAETNIKRNTERYIPKIHFGGRYECYLDKVDLTKYLSK